MYKDLKKRYKMNMSDTVIKDLYKRYTVKSIKEARSLEFESFLDEGGDWSDRKGVWEEIRLEMIKEGCSNKLIASVIAKMDSSGVAAVRGKQFEVAAYGYLKSLIGRTEGLSLVREQATVDWMTDYVDIVLTLDNGKEIYLSCTTDMWTGTSQSNRLTAHQELASSNNVEFYELILGEPPEFKVGSKSKIYKNLNKLGDRILYLGDIENKIKELN